LNKSNVKSASEDPVFFATAADFRTWLERHHDNLREQWVGFYKKNSGRPSITWPEAVDEALCFGWIDGLRKTTDENCYKIRFTPRKPTSNWSAVNIRRIQELVHQSRVRPAGLKSFERRVPEKSGIYSYENRHAAVLSKAAAKQFRSVRSAWEFFQQQPASYCQTAIWWVVSAKKPATQQKRLETLITDSKAKRRIKSLSRLGKSNVPSLDTIVSAKPHN
jgi:uncharacterized protein YdeI (YjbR/CyaY-like superfamily)